MPTTRKILSIAHSYVVALNRRLVNEIARLGQEEWEVTAVAPAFMHGDLRSLSLEADPKEVCRLEAVPVYFSRCIHFMTYGWQLKHILQQNWDLVHCWEEPYIFAGGQVAWWTPQKTPLIYSTFQNYNKQYPPPFNWIEQYAMSRATGWIGFGHTVVEAVKARPGYSIPMRLISPGVDVNHFHPSGVAAETIRRSLAWEAQAPPVIGYLGRSMPNWREQFGRMLIEAFACGVPVIGSDSGEIPYVIQDAGIVVGEKDLQGWIEALSDLLESPSRRQELAALGLHRAHTIYAWPVIAKQHLAFFPELLEVRSNFNPN